MDWLSRLRTGFGPAMPRPARSEALRAAAGAGLCLFLTGCLLWLIAPTGALLDHPLLIAPFAASSVLIFAVPNSPLAQPWAVVVGNTLSALCGLALLRLVPHPLPAAALATLAAVVVTSLARALHPPAGATAMAVVLSADSADLPGWSYALLPVATGSLALVLFGIAWNRVTGRVYPMRARPTAPHGTGDKVPDRRQAPSETVLAATLKRLRLGANLRVEDLARLIATAEAESAAAVLGQVTAGDMMSRDLIVATLDAPLPELSAQFRHHGFKSLPVIHDDGSFAGIIPIAAIVGLADASVAARDLIDPAIRSAEPATPVGELITLLSDGRQQAVPILRNEVLAGMVTRSDLIALLVHGLSHP